MDAKLKLKDRYNLDGGVALNVACALVMLVMVVLLFTPYWFYDGQSTSINTYVWFPTEQGALETYLTGALGEKVNVGDMVATPILLLLLGVAGAVFCVTKANWPITALISTLFGIIGILGYLSSGALKCGAYWSVHLALCACALAVGVWGVAAFFLRRRDA